MRQTFLSEFTLTQQSILIFRRITVSCILYNTQYFSRPSFANYISGFFNTSANATHPMVYQNQHDVYDFTTLMGITGFHAQGYLDMNTTFQDPNSFTVSTQNSADYFSVYYILFSTYYCPFSTPYFSNLDNLCYDQCPNRTVTDTVNLICSKCPFDC